jgi:nucleotide-binding universal stress UspA family protein
MNTILFATDGSPSARVAAQEAFDLARATGWQLRIVTVWRTPFVTSYAFAPVGYVPELADVEHEEAGRVAREALEAAQLAGVDASVEVREGDASAEICAAAKESHARLIVLGAHGWGAVKRLVFGSVSTSVLHHAPCPVLIAHDGGPAAEHARQLEEAIRA